MKTTQLQTISSILHFMQRMDSNGSWLEWLDEINHNESSFDPAYVIDTLQQWYEDSADQIFLTVIENVKTL